LLRRGLRPGHHPGQGHRRRQGDQARHARVRARLRRPRPGAPVQVEPGRRAGQRADLDLRGQVAGTDTARTTGPSRRQGRRRPSCVLRHGGQTIHGPEDEGESGMTTTVSAGALLAAGSIGFDYQAVIDQFWRLTVDGITYGSIYALVAVGYTLVYGVLRLINFAHSEIFMLGMFGQLIGLMIFGFTAGPDAYNQGVVLTVVYLGLAMVVGMLVSGSAAVGLERVAYRPLRRRGAKPLAFLIT